LLLLLELHPTMAIVSNTASSMVANFFILTSPFLICKSICIICINIHDKTHQCNNQILIISKSNADYKSATRKYLSFLKGKQIISNRKIQRGAVYDPGRAWTRHPGYRFYSETGKILNERVQAVQGVDPLAPPFCYRGRSFCLKTSMPSG